jgi:hypothetical protein
MEKHLEISMRPPSEHGGWKSHWNHSSVLQIPRNTSYTHLIKTFLIQSKVSPEREIIFQVSDRRGILTDKQKLKLLSTSG